MQTLTYLYNIGSICLHKILFIRRFIYSQINTFGLPKCSKIIFAFNIFVPIPVLEMVYLKTIQKITPMDISVSGTIDQKTYLKKFRGTSAPLAPPGSAYAVQPHTFCAPLLVFNERSAQLDFAVVNCSDAVISVCLNPCFNAQTDIFTIMNCCVVALSLFSSDIVTWSADSLYSVQ